MCRPTQNKFRPSNAYINDIRRLSRFKIIVHIFPIPDKSIKYLWLYLLFQEWSKPHNAIVKHQGLLEAHTSRQFSCISNKMWSRKDMLCPWHPSLKAWGLGKKRSRNPSAVHAADYNDKRETILEESLTLIQDQQAPTAPLWGAIHLWRISR